MSWRTIVADPPWQYGNGKFDTSGAERTKTSAKLRYGLLSLDDLAALPVSDLAEEDAHLWIWGTNMKLARAYALAESWGFEPITLVTWCKKQPGVGHYLRNNTEHVVFASRGKPQPPETKPLSTWFVWPRGEHSSKPDAFYDLVEQVSPGPYVELFARRARFGWDYAGDESLRTVELEGLRAGLTESADMDFARAEKAEKERDEARALLARFRPDIDPETGYGKVEAI